VEVLPGDMPQSLQRRVMEQAERLLLPHAVEQVCCDLLTETERKRYAKIDA